MAEITRNFNLYDLVIHYRQEINARRCQARFLGFWLK